MQCRRRDIRSLQRQSVNLHQELTALKVGEIDLRKAIDGKPLVFGRIRDRKQKATSVREEKSWVVRISKLISEQRQFGFLVALDRPKTHPFPSICSLGYRLLPYSEKSRR